MAAVRSDFDSNPDDQPKSLGDPGVRERRLRLIDDQHVRPLNLLVRTLKPLRPRPEDVPWFDPLDGGVNARFLFLFESPGPGSVESGFVSVNNPDETAAATCRLRRNAGLDRRDLLAWNVVPWLLGGIGFEASSRLPRAEDLKEASPWLRIVLDLCPRLEVVVTQGKHAQDAWRDVGPVARLGRALVHQRTPHPNPFNEIRRPKDRQTIMSAYRRLAEIASH